MASAPQALQEEDDFRNSSQLCSPAPTRRAIGDWTAVFRLLPRQRNHPGTILREWSPFPPGQTALKPAPAQSRHPPQIACRNLELSFAPTQPVLRQLSLDLPAGEITCLLGPSGCGKSTLLKCIAGLLQPQTGSIRFDDRPVKELIGRMSFVFQEPTLLPWRSVRSNVLLPLELQGRLGDPQCRAQVDRFLEIVGLLSSDQRKFPSELSGGMKMRASLARALATDPDILLLDEPFAALDDVLRNRLNELLLELVAERPRTVVFVTHNIAEAIFLSQQIAIIGRGEVRQLWRNPLPLPRQRSCRATPQFAGLFGEVASLMEAAAG